MSFSLVAVVRRVAGPARKACYRRLNRARRGAIHLFLLSPPLSGSTVVQQLIATSPATTCFGFEGQWLPEAAPLLGVEQRWDPALAIDWPRVRDAFESYWSPLRAIRFEKSPPHLVRARQIEAAFPNSHFLVSIRDPYAQVEGLLRRGWHPSATSAAEFWVKTAQAQVENLAQLQRTLFFTYEELTDRTGEVVRRLIEFLPQLGAIDSGARFSAHNITGGELRGLQNLNATKLKNLTAAQIGEVTRVLAPHSALLERFGYRLLEAST